MISLTEDFLAVGTSQRLMRLISLSGIQQRIIRLQAPIVCMSAYQNQLWIIQHKICRSFPWKMIIFKQAHYR